MSHSPDLSTPIYIFIYFFTGMPIFENLFCYLSIT